VSIRNTLTEEAISNIQSAETVEIRNTKRGHCIYLSKGEAVTPVADQFGNIQYWSSAAAARRPIRVYTRKLSTV
jgi:hypothetical protein